MESILAPIALFAYKRVDTLKQTVEALQNNYLAAASDLYIFSDAAKSSEDKIAVDKVREYIGSINGFKKVTVFESKLNKGLACSIIEGVSEVIIKYEKVITSDNVEIHKMKDYKTHMGDNYNINYVISGKRKMPKIVYKNRHKDKNNVFEKISLNDYYF